MRVPIARRNLLQSRVRFAIGAVGVALAALLVLMLDGVFAGTTRQVTTFMDRTPFDVVVSQRGVRNLHMTTSFFPAARLRQVRRVAGVRAVDPILYTTAFLVSGEQRSLAYLIGYEEGRLGGPWEYASGSRYPEPGEVLLDERIAGDLGVGAGDMVTVGGRDLAVGGLVRGTTSIVNSIAFVGFDDLAAAQRLRDVVSFGLVRVESGRDPQDVVRDIRGAVGGVTVQTRAEFAQSERRIIGDMSTDIIRMMNLIGLAIGLAVVGLTVYTATLMKLREYGILKALGAPIAALYRIVLAQAAQSVAAGLALAIAVSYALERALDLAGSHIPLLIEPASVVRVAIAAAIVGLVSSAIPIARIAGIQPVEVFRR